MRETSVTSDATLYILCHLCKGYILFTQVGLVLSEAELQSTDLQKKEKGRTKSFKLILMLVSEKKLYIVLCALKFVRFKPAFSYA